MNDETVYMVSGYMRCGTSMMMKALEEGGLEAVKRTSREVMRERYADEFYDPNEGGLYELETADYSAPGFPRQFKGQLIKCLSGGVPTLAVVPKLKVVYMRRDFEEIRQSYQAFFDQPLQLTAAVHEQRMAHAIELLRNRKDCDVHVFWYREVLNDPHLHFGILRATGWPIDIQAAASVVDPTQCRFRAEDLEPGIV